MTAPELFAQCHFHRICGNLVDPGETVCDTCLTEFGPLLHRRSVEPANTTAVVAPPLRARVDPDQARAEKRHRQDTGTQDKPGQRCWLCEHTRMCLLVDGRWECRQCRNIT